MLSKHCYIFLWGIVIGLGHVGSLAAQTETQIHSSSHMGSSFVLTARHESKTIAWKAIAAAEKEIVRIEALISSWDPSSQTSAINRAAGIAPVPVEEELFLLIQRALKVSKLTAGAFDISYASMDRVWKFDGSMLNIPDSAQVQASVAKVNYQRVMLDKENSSVYLQDTGMKIGFGAIGKGYAAMRAKAVMQKHGISSGLVNAGGDLVAWGEETEGKPWTIAIADPNKEKPILASLTLTDQALVTSGDYERFVDIGGIRYAHIIDPRSGYPVQGIKSVSIVCPDAELADALATSVFVMGKEKGLLLVEKLKGVECLIITSEDEIITSKNLHLSYE